MASYNLGREYVPKAREAALRALALDDRLAEAHTSLALIAQNHDWDWKKAEAEYRRAIELNPNYATAHHWYAEFLSFRGRFDEAFASSDRARRLDPLSLIIAVDRADMLRVTHQPERAIAEFRAVMAVEPEFPRTSPIIPSYADAAMFPEALEEIKRYRKLGDTLNTSLFEVYVYKRAGRMKEAQRALGRLEELYRRPGTDPALLARAYAGIDNTKALACLEQAYSAHSDMLSSLKVEPMYDALRGNPRFEMLLRRIGLVP